MPPTPNIFSALAQESAPLFQPVLRVGWLLGPPIKNTTHPALPSPFNNDAPLCTCTRPMEKIIQFWHAARLWRWDACLRCTSPTHWSQLRSAAMSGDMPNLSHVQGTTAIQSIPQRFVCGPSEPAYSALMHHTGLDQAVHKADEEEWLDALHAALDARSVLAPTTSHTDGWPLWLDTPVHPPCPQCATPMDFLAQIEADQGFVWGEGGAAYLWRCLHHPHHTHAHRQSPG